MSIVEKRKDALVSSLSSSRKDSVRLVEKEDNLNEENDRNRQTSAVSFLENSLPITTHAGRISQYSFVLGRDFDAVSEDLQEYNQRKEKGIKVDRKEKTAGAKKRRRFDECFDESRKQETGFSNPYSGISVVRADGPQGDVPFIDISKKNRIDSMPPLNVLIGPETRTSDPADIVITLRIPDTSDGLANIMPDLGQRMMDAIEASASRMLDPICGQSSSGQKETENDDSNPQIQTSSDTYCSNDATINAVTVVAKPIRSKRPISDILYPDHSVGDSATIHRVELGSAGLISPSIMPVQWKHVLLEELLMADEEWNRMPKQVQPLTGTSFKDMTEDDHQNLVHFMLTRSVKKHYRLSAVKKMPLVDQLTLMKAKSHYASMVFIAIHHHWRRHVVLVDYPGCPQVMDDIPKRCEGNAAKELPKFAFTYPDKCREDNTLTLILCVMAIFDNDLDVAAKLNPTVRGHFDRMSRSYNNLLKEHLRNKYGEAEASVGYGHLVSWLNCLSMLLSRKDYRARLDLDPYTFDVFNLQIPYLRRKDKRC